MSCNARAVSLWSCADDPRRAGKLGRAQQLRYIMDRVQDKSRIGVCLDTCHLFAAGAPRRRTDCVLCL